MKIKNIHFFSSNFHPVIKIEHNLVDIKGEAVHSRRHPDTNRTLPLNEFLHGEHLTNFEHIYFLYFTSPD